MTEAVIPAPTLDALTARAAPPPSGADALAVEQAVTSRRSVRGFLPTPVDLALVARLLTLAGRAPSGSNIQPWLVHVVAGQPLADLAADLTATFLSGAPERPDYAYYPTDWRAPYLDRRRKTGWGLYALTGVARGDHAAGQKQRARNYTFFGAPVCIVFTLERHLNKGSWVDCGMYMQSVMLLARAHGLDTCPLASTGNYPDIVRRHLSIPEDQIVLAGMAMGFADPDEPANRLRTERAPLADFCTFHITDAAPIPVPEPEEH